jgi:hypothetical protein
VIRVIAARAGARARAALAGAALAGAPAAGAACAPRTAHSIPIAILVDGEPVPGARLPAIRGLAPHALTLPPRLPSVPDDTAGRLAGARKAYAAGDFDACRAELAHIDVARALATGARDAAARALAFDAACAWGGQAATTARGIAAQLAGYGLALPDAPIAPDIEAVLGEAIVAAGNAHPHPVAVRGEPGARLCVDGRPPVCALPCTVDLVPGDHVLGVTADGFADAHRVIRVPETAEVTLGQAPASPSLAAAQWRARTGRGQPATDAVGARLIAQLGGERRIAVIHPGDPLTGVMIIDGALAASTTARRGDEAGLVRELAYDAGVLHRPAVWQRPWFWIAFTGIAIGVAATITVLTYQPAIHTSLDL